MRRHSPDDIRLLRRSRAAAAERLRHAPQAPLSTPEEAETEERIGKGRPWFDGPIPMLPVAQLYARDVPLPVSPPGADLLQVLWCPGASTNSANRSRAASSVGAAQTDLRSLAILSRSWRAA